MAEWIFIGARRYECSACGEGIPDMPCDWASGEPLYNFCPYCGVNIRKMWVDEPRGVEADCKTESQTSKIIEAYAKGFEDGAEAVKAMPQTESEDK